MPPRFRRPEQMATFELVPDDEREDADGPLGSEDDEKAEPTLRERAATRWRRLSHRGRVTVAAGSAVVVLAAATAVAGPPLLDARAERLRAEAVQGLPGAVDDLSEPLAETWETDNGDGVVTTFPSGVVLTTDGTEVWAVDVATGHEEWRRDVGADPTCGPQPVSPVDLARPVDVAVCLGGEPDARTVTVLDAAGTVLGERALGAVLDDPYAEATDPDVPLVMPAPDGAVAVVDHLPSGMAAPWDEDGSADPVAALRTLRAEGWVDPTLRLEDAVTGQVRTEVTARLRPEHLDGCNQMITTTGGKNEYSVQAVSSVDVSPSFTTLWACGATAVITAEGTVLDTSARSGWLQATSGGGYVVAGEESSILAPDGTLIATVPGAVLVPAVDDDPDGSALAVTGFDGGGSDDSRVISFGRDGHQEWALSVDTFPTVVARVAGTVVLQDDARLVGLDAATGAELWARDDLLDVADDGSGEWVVGALTDGTRVLLGLGGSDGGSHRLVSVDALDGTTAWERAGAGHLNALQSVDGNPVLLGSTLHGLG